MSIGSLIQKFVLYLIRKFGILTPSYDAATKTLHSPESRFLDKHPTTRSLGQQMYDGLVAKSKQVVQINADTGVRLTGTEMLEKSTHAAQNLLKIGVRPGDIVTICASNTDDVFAVLIGAVMAEAILNTLDVNFKDYELIHMLRIVEPQFIICDTALYGRMVQCMDHLNLKCTILIAGHPIEGVYHVSNLFAATNGMNFTPQNTLNFEDDIAFILCSSGSTGLSKAICLSQANILAGPKIKYNFTTSLTFSSLYWMSGIMSVVAGTVDGIPRVITRHPFSPDRFLDIVENYNAGFWYGSPTNFAQLLKSPNLKTADLSSLRTVAAIGAPLTEYYKNEMEKYVPKCVVSYGMTELGNVACMSLVAYKPGSVGTPMMHLSLRVVDASNGEILDRNQVGEIQAKTPFKFLGYYKNEAATRDALTTDGFYKTGDVGYIDEEGLVFIVGRKKEIMKFANVAIAPVELEQIMCQHPAILECCVTGIPSDEFNCLIAALVVKIEGSLVTEQQVEDFFNGQVQDAKRMRGGVYFVDSIPQTQSGKPRRNEVQNLVVRLKEEKLNFNKTP